MIVQDSAIVRAVFPLFQPSFEASSACWQLDGTGDGSRTLVSGTTLGSLSLRHSLGNSLRSKLLL